ncbi:hypothetical protein PACTADRAFT_47966 [Pachysolen tannophilus NRRL Y-2460]|uniref:DNA polymerase n=1 Tax=Pachysolen tannophilus NRRL Y-2460 TaxID=669874 RepID=A0A1E4U2C8_PACTA|nr:hypothetical protein PACTADRAFT_47966 [Pachysolen tannophilus NRRL Y-2460]
MDASTLSGNNDSFKLQILGYDSYQFYPSLLDRTSSSISTLKKHHYQTKSSFNQVPVIRVFGKLTTGHSILLNVHNVLPYFFIEYKGELSESCIKQTLTDLKLQLEKALYFSFKKGRKKPGKNNRPIDDDHGDIEEFDDQIFNDYTNEEGDDVSSYRDRYIASLQLIKSIPFYGYHIGYRPFIKINLLNPLYLRRLSNLLSEGKVNDKVIQPYESHVPYLLQFLTDYNLFGCDWLYLDEWLWRSPIINNNSNNLDIDDDRLIIDQEETELFNKLKLTDDLKAFLKNNIKKNKFDDNLNILSEDQFSRIGNTFLEIDCLPQWISNRKKITTRDLHQDFIELFNNLNNSNSKFRIDKTKYLNSTKDILKDILHQRKLKNLDDSQVYLNKFSLTQDSEERIYDGHTNWIEQDELEDLLKHCIDLSKEEWERLNAAKNVQNDVKLEGFHRNPKIFDNIPTAFQCIENELYDNIIWDDFKFINQVNSNDDDILHINSSVISDNHTNGDSDKSNSDSSAKSAMKVSILDNNNDFISSGEEEEETDENLDYGDDDNWMGTVPPHKSQIFLDDEEVDEYDDDKDDKDNKVDKDGNGNNTSTRLGDSTFEEIEKNFFGQNEKSTKMASNILKSSSRISLSSDPLDQSIHNDSEIALPENNIFKNFSLQESDITGNSDRFTDKADETSILVESGLKLPKNSESAKWFEFQTGYELPSLTCANISMEENFLNSLEKDFKIPKIEYDDPFYSDRGDLPPKPFIFAGKKFVLQAKHVDYLPKVEDGGIPISYLIKEFMINKTNRKATKVKAAKTATFCYLPEMPSIEEVSKWSKVNSIENDTKQRKSVLYKSQVEQRTQSLEYGFKYPSIKLKYQRKPNNLGKLICFAVELHINTRDDLKPDPSKDEITAIFWKFDKIHFPYDLDIAENGILILNTDLRNEEQELSFSKKLNNTSNTPIAIFNDEVSMVKELISLVKLIDPDILAGFEIHSLSWGYIIERFRKIYLVDICAMLSRVNYKYNNKVNDRWGYNHASGIKISGRHMLNIWRGLRHEINLLKYSIENICYHTLHRRIPHYPEKQLTEWFRSGIPNQISIVLNYYTQRLSLDLEIIENQEMITKTVEQSRLIGIDFYSILSRGSQFKVESFLIRLTKSENFILISPSKKQVFKSDALQCIPLIMEPESAYYKSPLVVLDFQSLYPSIIIAYNYCYSTVLGRLRGFDARKPQTIGVTKNKLPAGLLELLKDYITISPNGLIYVNETVRKSSLAKMLTEILETRILVKDTMKIADDDYELKKLYNSRQLALKLIANVTYGYTSATFSGRMPCADIADSIVSTARETLNNSIKEIAGNKDWGAQVVYGDTDSLFIYLPGKTRQDAFRIGNEMADFITSKNPKPIKLKFEKVYHPCLLVSKKRYVGYSYENENQLVPKFDAKGIETVRRDGIPAQQKMVEKSLRLLFETNDLSLVKKYVQDQFVKIMNNKISIQDLCFAKEIKVGTYKDERYIPAGANLYQKLMEVDSRAEPQYAERLPYVVLKSYKGKNLRDRCVTPLYFIENEIKENLQLDHEYYITKTLIPPLERIFNLIGADVKQWYRELPKIIRFDFNNNILNGNKRRRASQMNNNNGIHYFIKSMNCLSCFKNISNNKMLCEECIKDELSTILKLNKEVSNTERTFANILMICRSCSSSFGADGDTSNIYTNGNRKKRLISDDLESGCKCNSDDCQLYYSRIKLEKRLNKVYGIKDVIMDELDW